MIRTREEAQPYARQIADIIGLRDWTIDVLRDQSPPNSDAHATVYAVYGRRYLTIRLSDSVFREPADKQRYIITHELCHAFTAAADVIAEEGLGKDVYRAFLLMHEYAVDAVASALAPFLPLPGDLSWVAQASQLSKTV